MSEMGFTRRAEAHPSGCWLWIGRIHPKGYGQFRGSGAHRWAYKFFIGPVPEGLELDHLCRIRNCVNPTHLEPVTHKVNLGRGRHALREKTACPQGHPYAGANLYRPPGANRRMCRTCYLARITAWNARHPERTHRKKVA